MWKPDPNSARQRVFAALRENPDAGREELSPISPSSWSLYRTEWRHGEGRQAPAPAPSPIGDLLQAVAKLRPVRDELKILAPHLTLQQLCDLLDTV